MDKPVKEPAAASKSLYKEVLTLGKREYTFEFRESAKGNKFFSVTDRHERNGKESRDSILIFEDQVGKFMESMNKMLISGNKP